MPPGVVPASSSTVLASWGRAGDAALTPSGARRGSTVPHDAYQKIRADGPRFASGSTAYAARAPAARRAFLRQWLRGGAFSAPCALRAGGRSTLRRRPRPHEACGRAGGFAMPNGSSRSSASTQPLSIAWVEHERDQGRDFEVGRALARPAASPAESQARPGGRLPPPRSQGFSTERRRFRRLRTCVAEEQERSLIACDCDERDS